MPTIHKSVDVAVPIRTAYNQWTQFEEFPRFMEGVESVRQVDDRRLEWKAKIAGKTVEWSAEILEQVPDERIAWRSTSGAPNHGAVRFESLAPGRTRIHLTLEFEPHGALEKTAENLGLVEKRVAGDLDRFRRFLETRGEETGAWRGRIEAHDAGSPPLPPAPPA